MASEGLPLGMAEPTVATEVGVRPESPEIGANALSVASRLLCGAATFFFLAFLFAYFYLRSVNISHMWRPAHVNPDKTMGAVFIACLLISVILSIVAGRQMKAGSKAWVGAAAGAVVLGIVAVIAQCIGYTSQHFGPTNGAFASVFCAWTGVLPDRGACDDVLARDAGRNGAARKALARRQGRGNRRSGPADRAEP